MPNEVREREKEEVQMFESHTFYAFLWFFRWWMKKKKQSYSVYVCYFCMRAGHWNSSITQRRKENTLAQNRLKRCAHAVHTNRFMFFCARRPFMFGLFFYLTHKNKGEFIKTSKWKKKLSKQNAIYSDFVIIIFASGPCVVGILWWCFES